MSKEAPAAKAPKKRTPKGYDSILAGAMKLSIAERTSLALAIKSSIAADVADLKAAADKAQEDAKGL